MSDQEDFDEADNDADRNESLGHLQTCVFEGLRIMRAIDSFCRREESARLPIADVFSLLSNEVAHIDNFDDLTFAERFERFATKPNLDRSTFALASGWKMVRVPLQSNVGGIDSSFPLIVV